MIYIEKGSRDRGYLERCHIEKGYIKRGYREGIPDRGNREKGELSSSLTVV